MALTAAPSDALFARLKETVVARNCPRCVTSRGAAYSWKVAMDDSGTCPFDAVDEGR